MTFSAGTTPVPFIQNGQIHALGVTSAQAGPPIPGVAPLRDSIPGFEFVAWYGVLAPVGTPTGIVEQLNRLVNDVLSNATVRAKLERSGHVVLGGTQREFVRTIDDDLKKFEGIISTLGLGKSGTR